MFLLCWTQHGGSGLSIDYATALDLPIGDADWLVDRIGKRRAEEAKAIKSAG